MRGFLSLFSHKRHSKETQAALKTLIKQCGRQLDLGDGEAPPPLPKPINVDDGSYAFVKLRGAIIMANDEVREAEEEAGKVCYDLRRSKYVEIKQMAEDL